MSAPSHNGRHRRSEIKRRIVAWIDEHALRPGDRIPPQVRLAKLLETTEVTVHRALRELAAEGIVRRAPGRGTFVAPHSPHAPGRTVCFVLPGEGLDRPDANPGYWMVVQTVLRGFLHAATVRRRPFTIRAVRRDEPVAEVVRELEQHFAVFFHYTQEPRAVIHALVDRGRAPVVCLGRAGGDLDCLTVDHDRTAGVRRGVEALVAAGYGRIGFVGNRAFWGDLSLEGYAAALADRGLAVEARRIERIDGDREAAANAAGWLLDRAPETDAIFADSDLAALGVLDGLKARDDGTADRVGVMGYDGLDAPRFGPPHLTTIRIPFEAIFETGIREVEALPDRRTPRRHIALVGEILPGRTARIPADGTVRTAGAEAVPDAETAAARSA